MTLDLLSMPTALYEFCASRSARMSLMICAGQDAALPTPASPFPAGFDGEGCAPRGEVPPAGVTCAATLAGSGSGSVGSRNVIRRTYRTCPASSLPAGRENQIADPNLLLGDRRVHW